MSDWLGASLTNSAYTKLYTDLQRLLIKRLWARLQRGTQHSQQTSPRVGAGQGGHPSAFDSLIEAAAHKYGVDSGLVKAVIRVESNFDPNAVSHAGAKGLMQLMDGTAAALGVQNSFDVEQNIEGGVAYLDQQLHAFRGNLRLALAAYNAGPGTVRKYGDVPPIDETQTYVQRVMDFYNEESPPVQFDYTV